MDKLSNDPKVNGALEHVAAGLNKKKIPVIKEDLFYAKTKISTPYIAIGAFEYDKLERAHNRICKQVFQNNKKLAILTRKMLREFYHSRKGVKSSNKIMYVEAPDYMNNIRLVNRGYKSARPYMLKERLAKGDKRGAKKLMDRMSAFTEEFNKFAKFLVSKMKVNEKNKYEKMKAGDAVMRVGIALVSMASAKTRIIHTHYDNDLESYPMLELQSVAKKSDIESLARLKQIHKNKNETYFKKVSALLSKFYAKHDVDNSVRIIVGFPYKQHCTYSHRFWSSQLGVFAIYNMGAVEGNDKMNIDYIAEFSDFAKSISKKQ